MSYITWNNNRQIICEKMNASPSPFAVNNFLHPQETNYWVLHLRKVSWQPRGMLVSSWVFLRYSDWLILLRRLSRRLLAGMAGTIFWAPTKKLYFDDSKQWKKARGFVFWGKRNGREIIILSRCNVWWTFTRISLQSLDF